MESAIAKSFKQSIIKKDKKMKTTLKIALCILVIASTLAPAYSQDAAKDKKDAKAAAIRRIIEAKNYVFTAQIMAPMGGMTRNLTSVYDLTVTPDTVISYLPYFGRAYTAPIDPTQNGLQFTSVKFDYKITDRKKGGWDIYIVTKDQADNERMSLIVFENGIATLQVTSNNRQPISFNGYVSERRQNKKKII
jgi:hypothetical protein